MSKKAGLEFHHLGIPTNTPIEGEIYLKDYKVYHYGYEKSEYGIEWMRYEKDCQLPEIVKTVPHIVLKLVLFMKRLRARKCLLNPIALRKEILLHL